jgi:hypothetical protein
MCKSQYDIVVEKQRMGIERKKKRDDEAAPRSLWISAALFTYLSHSS